MSVVNHEDVMASLKRTMKREEKAKKESAEDTTTAGDGLDEGAAAEDDDPEASGDEGGEDGAGKGGEGGEGDDAGDAELNLEEEEGSEDEPGSDETESDDTTADGEESEASPEEQASEEEGEPEGDEPEGEDSKSKWDKEQQKAIEAIFGKKDAAKVECNPATRKLLKIASDNKAALQREKQQVALLNDHISELGGAVLDHNLEALNAIAEELGGEKLPFDTRTPMDKAKELVDGFNAVYDALKKGLPKEIFDQVEDALGDVHDGIQEKVAAFKEEMTLKKAEEAGRRASGKRTKGGISKELEAKSTQNFTDLKSKDPEAQARFEALKPYFSGGILRDSKRLYALNPRLVDELGKHVEFSVNFQKKYLAKIRKSFERAQKVRKNLKAPPAGGRPQGARTPARPGGAPAPSRTSNFNKFAGQKYAERFL